MIGRSTVGKVRVGFEKWKKRVKWETIQEVVDTPHQNLQKTPTELTVVISKPPDGKSLHLALNRLYKKKLR